ncbi:hypothetical protein ACFQ08_20025 [Streptosporangium algeriense]|uniref:Uncharacterized protein n=1 Tax=Streptosporangium algeriense TaxID=1682748 RepID=A0ABW3DUY9_9ACTN
MLRNELDLLSANLIEQGAGESGTADLIAALKRDGRSMLESVYVVSKVFSLSPADAKPAVATSPSWVEESKEHERFHEKLIEEFEHEGWSPAPASDPAPAVSTATASGTMRHMNTAAPDMDGVLDRGPVGRWRTACGTAVVLVGEEVVFAPDGTGVLHTRSVAFGTEVLEFRWRMLGRGRLWIESEDAGEGVPILLEFRAHETDTGRQTVLAEAGQDGFWILLDPLERVGDA